MANRKRILVVDDDADLVELLQADLEHRGYEIVVATNGQEALNITKIQRFDLLLLDIMMPEIDGYRVVNAVTSTESQTPPKIILMTCRDTRRESGLALLAGVAAMVQKPFTMEALHQKIVNVLESH